MAASRAATSSTAARYLAFTPAASAAKRSFSRSSPRMTCGREGGAWSVCVWVLSVMGLLLGSKALLLTLQAPNDLADRGVQTVSGGC